MMDHALRTISYIADIGDLLVLMARRRTPLEDPNDQSVGGGGNTGSGTSAATGAASGSLKRLPKMICHVFESEEAQYIAQSIGQAFQVAYMEFLKANGIEDSSFLKEMDYQEVLNSQEIFGNELEMFAKREKQKEVMLLCLHSTLFTFVSTTLGDCAQTKERDSWHRDRRVGLGLDAAHRGDRQHGPEQSERSLRAAEHRRPDNCHQWHQSRRLATVHVPGLRQGWSCFVLLVLF